MKNFNCAFLLSVLSLYATAALAATNADALSDVPDLKPEYKTACRCGDVLQGKITPNQCPLFGKACNPDHPVGACMVSDEGACSAFYMYGGDL